MHRKSHRQEQYPFCEDPARYQRCLVLETLHMMHQTTLDCRAMPVVVYSKMPRRLFLSICVLPYVPSSSPFSIDLVLHSPYGIQIFFTCVASLRNSSPSPCTLSIQSRGCP